MILRSANHIIDDQVRFSEAYISEVRRSSFEYSQRSETSFQKKKATTPTPRLFDLEDEDNPMLHHVDDADDEDLQENFVSMSLIS